MRSWFPNTNSFVRALTLGLALMLANLPVARASVTASPAAGSIPVVAAGSAGWVSTFLAEGQAPQAGTFDRRTVLTLLLTALAAIAVVRVAEHRNRPGQDR